MLKGLSQYDIKKTLMDFYSERASDDFLDALSYAIYNTNLYQTSYVMPDGTAVNGRPTDRQVWVRYDMAGNPSEFWQWNDNGGFWANVTNTQSNHPSFGGIDLDDNGDIEFFESLNINELLAGPPKCQCGKEKHGFASHSPWCDVKD